MSTPRTTTATLRSVSWRSTSLRAARELVNGVRFPRAIACAIGIASLFGVARAQTSVGVHLPAQAEPIHWMPAQEPRDEFLCPDAPPIAMAAQGDTLYLSGMTWMGLATGSLARLDPGTGAPDRTWPRVDGTIRALAADGNGGWFLGGSLSRVGGRPRTALAHLLADGTVATWAPVVEGTVSAMVLDGDELVIAGNFGLIQGQPRRGLAALDAFTGRLLVWNPVALSPAFSGEISALYLDGGILHAGGFFQCTVGGVACRNYARVSRDTGAYVGPVLDPDGAVLAFHAIGNELWVGGNFDVINGQPRSKLALIDVASWALLPFSKALNGAVLALDSDASTLYVAGHFTAVQGSTRRKAAAFQLPSTALLPWNPNVQGISNGSGDVNSMRVEGARVYLGGNFASAGGAPARNFAVVDAATGAAVGWTAPISGENSETVHVIEREADRVVLAGYFQTVGGGPRAGLAALDARRGTLRTWSPVADGAVTTILPAGRWTYLGGAFRFVNGVERPLVARVDSTTGVVDPGFSAGLSSGFLVRTLALQGNRLFLGGSMNALGFGDFSISSVDATTGSVLGGWRQWTGGSVNTLELSSDASVLFVGGGFSSVGLSAVPRSRLAALDAATGSVLAWDPSANAVPSSTVQRLVRNGDDLLLAGDFLTIGGLPRRALAEVSGLSGLPSALHPVFDTATASASLSGVATLGSLLVIAGGYAGVDGQPGSNLSCFDRRTEALLPWFPNPSPGAGNVLLHGRRLFVTGGFRWMAGQHHPYLAVFDLEPIP